MYVCIYTSLALCRPHVAHGRFKYKHRGGFGNPGDDEFHKNGAPRWVHFDENRAANGMGTMHAKRGRHDLYY